MEHTKSDPNTKWRENMTVLKIFTYALIIWAVIQLTIDIYNDRYNNGH